MTIRSILRDVLGRTRCPHGAYPSRCLHCLATFNGRRDSYTVARMRIRQALAEAGVELRQGEHLTKEQYQLLPQWFRDEVEEWARLHHSDD